MFYHSFHFLAHAFAARLFSILSREFILGGFILKIMLMMVMMLVGVANDMATFRFPPSQVARAHGLAQDYLYWDVGW